jgi:hydroxyacid-oxoacid transhydrogenase
MNFENIMAMHTSSIKYGFGATREVGYDMRRLGGQRVMVVTDPNLSNSESVSIAMAALRAEGMDAVLFDEVHIEPTDVSFKHAIQFAIDTAKVANLYATFPAEFLAYVNHPIGEGRPVPGQLAPMIAIPTTAGTGSETTGVAIFDFLDMHTKTGIAHPALRPVLGIVDPDNTRTLPKMAVACTGWDVLCHALESLTTIPFDKRPAPEHPSLRPAYQGSNPISDVWAARAIELVSEHIVTAVHDPNDDEARAKMLLAACFAGIGFGNAGVHLPHGMSYPVSSLRHEHVVEGYPADNPLIPHGMAVTLNAPAVFRFTGQVNPERHLYAASLMGVDVTDTALEDAGDLLAETIIDLMKQTGMPNGLGAVGYKLEDVDALVAGTLPQHRVTKLSPQPAGAEELRQLFVDSMTLW